MSNIRAMTKNFITLGLAQVVSTGLALVLVILVTRFLGDAGYGQLSFAMSLAATLTVLTPLGLDQLIIREVARRREMAAKYLGHALAVQSAVSALAFVSFTLVACGAHLPTEATAVLYLAGAYYVCINLAATLKSVFRAYERMEYDALLTSGRNAVTVAAGLAALLLGFGLPGVAAAYLLAAALELAATAAVTVRRFTRPRLAYDPAFLRSALPAAFPFAVLALLAITYTQTDVLILKALQGDAPVGWYRAATAVVYAFSNIPAILSSTVFPALARFHVSAREYLALTMQKSAKYLLVLGLPIATGLMLLAKPIVALFYGPDFLPAVPALCILAVFIPFSFLNSILGVTLAAIDKQHLRLALSLVCTLARLVLNYLLILRLSLTGAAIAIVASEALLFALNYRFSARHLPRLRLDRLLLRPCLASLGMAVLVFFLRDLSLLAVVPLGAALYFALFLASGGLDAEDRALLGSIWRELGRGKAALARPNGTK